MLKHQLIPTRDLLNASRRNFSFLLPIYHSPPLLMVAVEACNS